MGGTRGVVTSPGYPGVTNTSGDCWWVVRVPQGQRIQLRSVRCRIELQALMVNVKVGDLQHPLHGDWRL